MSWLKKHAKEAEAVVRTLALVVNHEAAKNLPKDDPARQEARNALAALIVSLVVKLLD